MGSACTTTKDHRFVKLEYRDQMAAQGRPHDARALGQVPNEADVDIEAMTKESLMELARSARASTDPDFARDRWQQAQKELNEAIRVGDSERLAKAYEKASTELGVGSAPPRKSQVLGLGCGAPTSNSCSDAWVALKRKSTMLFAVFLFSFECIAYNLVFLQRILPARGKSAFVMPLALVFNVIWCLAAWSFLQAHLTDPGFVNETWYSFCKRMGDALPVAPARLEWQPGKATFCKKCHQPRPERAHHCQFCNMCVMRMDHHCPWIENCVGFNNHKYFLLLTGYTFLACMTVVVTSAPEFLYCLRAFVHSSQSGRWELDERPLAVDIIDALTLTTFQMIALIFGTLLGPMCISHWQLSTSNMTTIEAHYEDSNMPNPFDQGGTMVNLSVMFGHHGPDWYLPVRPARPTSDGICFLRVQCNKEDDDGESESVQSVSEHGEDLWKLRYKVRTPPAQLEDEGDARSTASIFNLWWQGSDTPEAAKRGSIWQGLGLTSVPARKEVTKQPPGKQRHILSL